MSAQQTQPGHEPGKSGGLTLNLSSNNPFRNRVASPSPSALNSAPSPSSPFDDPFPPPPQRPVSRNPFLDPSFSSSQPNLAKPTLSPPPAEMASIERKASPTAEEIFDNLTLDDGTKKMPPPPRPEGAPPPRPMNRPPGPPGAPGRENMPPGPGRRGPPPPGHRPTRSQEEALRARRMQNGPRPNGAAPSPQRRPQQQQQPSQRRPRRNSESSIMDIEKPTADEEKKAREARRRERERRREKGTDGKDKEKKPRRHVDLIDQLDHTSLFGGSFHHDGPFDALTSHRNRRGRPHAPMQAFPKDSLNMSLGGSGPLNKTADQATLMGTANDEAFKEYSSSGAVNKNGYYYPKSGEAPVFDPRGRAAVMHGDESLGLGTSTFLEGTPAARAAVQQRQEEQLQRNVSEGMQRKKSIAHRIRNMNNGGGKPQPNGRLTNPEAVYGSGSRTSPDAVGPATTGHQGERNPFFNEFGKEPENISVKRADAASPTSPPPPVPRRDSDYNAPLERRVTADAASPTTEQAPKQPSGFLSRVKSLKGGRRNRQPSDAVAPGSAV